MWGCVLADVTMERGANGFSPLEKASRDEEEEEWGDEKRRCHWESVRRVKIIKRKWPTTHFSCVHWLWDVLHFCYTTKKMFLCKILP